MSLIQIAKFSDTLRRYLQMAGTSEVASELAAEISPVLVMEQDRPDWLWLKGERLCATTIRQSSGVTPGPTMRLRNPTTSKVIATVSHIWVSATNVGIVELRFNLETTDLGIPNLSRTLLRDGRGFTAVGADNTSLVGSYVTTHAPVGNIIFNCRAASSQPIEIKGPIVITPGRSIDLGSLDTAAQGMAVTMWWSERQLSAIEAV